MNWNWLSFKNKKAEAQKTNTESPFNNPILWATIGSSQPAYIKLTGTNKIQADLLICDFFNLFSEVSAPIRKYSDQVKNVQLYFQDRNLSTIETDTPTIKAIKKFWANSAELFFIYDLLLGNAYIQGLESGTFETKGLKTLTELILLPSEFTDVKIADAQQDFRSINIKAYNVDLPGNYKEINLTDTEKVLHIKTPSTFSYTQNGIYGLSRLIACEKNIQSIASGYGAKIALYDNGPRVIITGKAQGEFASANQTEDIKDVQKKLNNDYGRTDGQFQMMATDVPLDATIISLNVRELMINENNASDFRRICNAYNQDSKIHGDPESTTYDNMQTALSDFYNSPFKSLVDNRLKKLNDFVNKWDEDLIIKANYSNIKEIAQFEKVNEAMIFEDAAKGLITRNEYLEQTNQATVNSPEFDQYFTYNESTSLWISLEQKEQGNGTQ